MTAEDCQTTVTFVPCATMTRRPDGGWDLYIDWTDSLLGAVHVSGVPQRHSSTALEAEAALREWLSGQSPIVTIPRQGLRDRTLDESPEPLTM